MHVHDIVYFDFLLEEKYFKNKKNESKNTFLGYMQKHRICSNKIPWITTFDYGKTLPSFNRLENVFKEI